MSNILIIAPHADDEVLGCGGSINYFKRNGYNIFVSILTNANIGDKKKYSQKYILNLRKEALKSHKYLGIKKTFFYDFPAPFLDQYPIAKIADELSKLFRKLEPKILFIPHLGDSHVDHQIVHQASLVGARPLKNNDIPLILSYETLSETEWSAKKNKLYFDPNYFIALNKRDVKKN